jgi:hypothetical protein
MSTTLTIKDLPFSSEQTLTKSDFETLPSGYWVNEAQEALDASVGSDEDTLFYNLCRSQKCEVLSTPITYKVTRFEQSEEQYFFDVEFQVRCLSPDLIAEQLELGNKEALTQIKTFEDFEGVVARFDPLDSEINDLYEAHPVFAEIAYG